MHPLSDRQQETQAAGIAQGNHSHQGQPSQGAGVGASRPQAAPHPTPHSHPTSSCAAGRETEARWRAGPLRTREASPSTEGHNPSQSRTRARLLGGVANTHWTLEAPPGTTRPAPPRIWCGRWTDGWMDRGTRKGPPGRLPAAGRAPSSRHAPGSGVCRSPSSCRSGLSPQSGAADRPSILRFHPTSRAPGLCWVVAPLRGSRLRPGRGLAAASGGSWTYFCRADASRDPFQRSLGTGWRSPATHPAVAEIWRWRGRIHNRMC